VSEQKPPVDHFTVIPRRFTDAHIADEIDSMHLVIGLHIAARCYEVRNTSDGTAAIRLSWLAELCGDISTETIRRKLHELEPDWIVCEVGQGQRSAWRIRLTGLAQEPGTATPLPHDLHTTSTKPAPPAWKSTSTAPEAGETAIPLGERDASLTRLPHRISQRQDKRNETKRNEDETRAASSEKLDHLGVETTGADFDAAEFIQDQRRRDSLERARRFDEMFPPKAKR
jgi:hypothetical protein